MCLCIIYLPNLLVFVDLQLSEMEKKSFLLQISVPQNLKKVFILGKVLISNPYLKTYLRYFASQLTEEVKLKEF